MAARTDFVFRRLFLDAFEDDDARVGRDPDREDHAREARQRLGDVEQQDDGVEERVVEREADDRDKAEEPVDEQQEERDNRKPDERRRDRLAQRVLPERCGDSVRSICSNSTGRGAVCRTSGVLGLADVADPQDLGAAARDATGVVVPVDRRRRLDLAVEDDREALERLLLRYALFEICCPRAASSRVISWNLSPPLSVNSIRTTAPSPCRKSWRGGRRA